MRIVLSNIKFRKVISLNKKNYRQIVVGKFNGRENSLKSQLNCD